MSEQKTEPKDSDDDRGRGNVMLIVCFVVIVGVGIWLVNALLDARNADDCLSRGRRNCNPIEVPAR